MENEKAVVIQCCVRQWLARQTVRCLRRERRRLDAINLEKRQLQLEETTFQAAVKGVIKIQCAWRQHLAWKQLLVQRKRFANGDLQKQWQQYALLREATKLKLQQLDRAFGGQRMQTIYSEEKTREHLLAQHQLEIDELRGRQKILQSVDRAFEMNAEELRLAIADETSFSASDLVMRDEFLRRKKMTEEEKSEWQYLRPTLLVQLEWAWKAEREDIGRAIVLLFQQEKTARHALVFEEGRARKTLFDNCLAWAFEMLLLECESDWDFIIAEEAVEMKRVRMSFRLGRRKAKEVAGERQRFWEAYGALMEREGAEREYFSVEEVFARRSIKEEYETRQQELYFTIQLHLTQHQEAVERKQIMNEQVAVRLEYVSQCNEEGRQAVLITNQKNIGVVSERIQRNEVVRRTDILKEEKADWLNVLGHLWLEKIEHEIHYTQLDEEEFRQNVVDDEETQRIEMEEYAVTTLVSLMPTMMSYRESIARADLEQEEFRCWDILMATYDQLHEFVVEMRNLRELEVRDHAYVIQRRLGDVSPTFKSPLFAPMASMGIDDDFMLDDEEMTLEELEYSEEDYRFELMDKEDDVFYAMATEGICALEHEHRLEIEEAEHEAHWSLMYQENIGLISLSTQTFLLQARVNLSTEALVIHEQKGQELIERLFKRYELYRKVRTKALAELAKAKLVPPIATGPKSARLQPLASGRSAGPAVSARRTARQTARLQAQTARSQAQTAQTARIQAQTARSQAQTARSPVQASARQPAEELDDAQQHQLHQQQPSAIPTQRAAREQPPIPSGRQEPSSRIPTHRSQRQSVALQQDEVGNTEVLMGDEHPPMPASTRISSVGSVPVSDPEVKTDSVVTSSARRRSSTGFRSKFPASARSEIGGVPSEHQDHVQSARVQPVPVVEEVDPAQEELAESFRTLIDAMNEMTQQKMEFDQKMEELELRAQQLSSRTPRVTMKLEREQAIAPLKPSTQQTHFAPDVSLDESGFDISLIPTQNALTRAYLDSADENLEVSGDQLASLASIHAVIHGDSTTAFTPSAHALPRDEDIDMVARTPLFSPSPPSKKRPLVGASGVPIRKFPFFSLDPQPRPTSVDADPNYCPDGHGLSPTYARTNDGDHAVSYPSHYSRNLSPMATRIVHDKEKLVGTDTLSRILFEQKKSISQKGLVDGQNQPSSRPSSAGSPLSRSATWKMYSRMSESGSLVRRASFKDELVPDKSMSVASSMMPTLRPRPRNRSPRSILKIERSVRATADVEAAAKIDRKNAAKASQFAPLTKDPEMQLANRNHLRSTVTNTTAHCDHHLSQRGNLKVCCMKCLVNTYSTTLPVDESPTAQ